MALFVGHVVFVTPHNPLHVSSVLFQDVRQGASGPFANILTHEAQYWDKEEEQNSSVFNEALKNTDIAEMQAHGESRHQRRPYMLLQVIRRSMLYNAECRVTKPRINLHVDFLNALLLYLVHMSPPKVSNVLAWPPN